MLVNPGGPGGAGRSLALLGGSVPKHAGDAYDWIGFDPRGVGASKPALSCVPDYGGYNRPEYDPAKAPGVVAAWQARAERYAAACATQGWRAAVAPHHRGRRQGPGHHPQGAGRQADQLLRLLLRHLPRPGLRHPLPAEPAAGGVRRRGRPPRGVVPGQPRPGRRVPEGHRGVLRLDRQERRRLPPRQLRRRRREALLRRAGQAPGRSGGRQDRPVRVDRHLPAGGLLRLGLGEDRVDVREVGAEARRGRARGALRRHGLDRRRQRLRDLPRRPVHRHALAAAVRPGARRQHAGGGHRAVRDVGQRLVQRALPDVEGARAASR